MWKETLEAKLIRIEGFEASCLTTSVFISNILSEELDPYNKDSPIELPPSSLCRIVINAPDSSKSISFCTNILEEDGVQWLPLFENNQHDEIKTVPEEVTTPRLLILVQKRVKIEENQKISENNSECDGDYMPEIKLSLNFSITEEFVKPFDDNFEENSQKCTEICEVGQLSRNLADEIKAEFKVCLEKSAKMIELERKSKENAIKEMESMKNRFLQQLIECKAREEEILKDLQDIESRFSAEKCENLKLKNEIKALNSENNGLKQTINDLEVCNLNKIGELTSKIQILEETSPNFEQILSKISEITEPHPSAYSETVKENEEIIKKLRKEINELRVLNNSLQISRQNTNIDELEETIQKYSKKFRLSETFVRDKEQIYIYGTKKISVLLKDGQLLCRVGGIFKPFDEYVNTFLLTTNSQKIGKNNAETSRDVEESNKIKTNQSKKLNKSVNLGSKPVKRGSLY